MSADVSLRTDVDQDGRATVDLDHMSPEFSAHSHALLREMHEKCPVAWSEHHGGVWIVSDYDAVAEVAGDDDRFSSHHDLADPGSPYRGISIPETQEFMGFIEMDPPGNMKFRKPWQKWFSPGASERMLPRMRQVAAAVLDRCIESGRIDLVRDFASPVPAILVLEYLGLPIGDWQRIADDIHSLVSTPPSDPRWAEYAQGWVRIGEQVTVEIEARRKEPRDDLLSAMVHLEIDGEPYPDDLLHGDVMDFISGGVDTTTALTSFALLHLGRHPEDKQRLIDDPALRHAACEEFLRFFSPITSLARTVTRDTVLAGQQLRAGDRMLVFWSGANIDEKEFADADTVKIDREPNRHTAFGLGVHRCIGSNFARADFHAMLDEVLDRIPDYTIDESSVAQYPGIGIVNGYSTIGATFTPGARTGARL